MKKGYDILNECLLLLGKGSLPTAYKLRIEVGLIQLKRLFTKVDKEVGDPPEFENLLAQVRKVSESGGAGFSELIAEIAELQVAMTLFAPPRSPAPSPKGLFQWFNVNLT